MTYTLLPLLSLTQRELMRFYRQRSRIVGSLLTPVIFWILLGFGLQASLPEGANKNFVLDLFPANLVMTLLFTAIFSTISIIEDRHEGLLQSVLVAPVSRTALVGGKVFGGAFIGLFQGILFLLLAPLAGFHLDFVSVLLLIPAMFVVALGMTALGFIFAWRLDSVQGFHSVMNLFLFPMWLMSGSFFPLSRAPLVLKGLMYLNPLTYGVAAIQQGLQHSSGGAETLSYGLGLGVSVLFAFVFYGISMLTVSKDSGVGK